MLKYMILVVEVMLVPTIIYALMGVYNKDYTADSGDRLRKPIEIAAGLAFILSAVIAYLKAYTALINKAWYSIIILSFELPIMLLLTILLLVYIKKKNLIEGKLFRTVSTLYTFFMAAYSLPTVLLYISEFPMGESGLFSTAVLFKVMGYLFSAILVMTFGIGLYKITLKYDRNKAILKTVLVMWITWTWHLFALIQPLFVRRIIPFSKPLFKVLTFIINNKYLFIYATIIVVISIPFSVWYRSNFITEPYNNPAEHRKIRAELRRRKRWSRTIVFVVLFSVLNLTVVKAYDEREVQLSPVEESVEEGDFIYIPIENVDDGSLHRFHHMAENGRIEVRFIVIKKSPTSFGIGLDACEICGATGYYQRGEAVVCKRCDVVMNIQTIGFKGGCNPIPFEYEIEDGRIKIKKETLENLKEEFR